MSVITKQSHGLAKKEGILVGRRSNFAWFRAGFHLIPLGPVLSRTYHLPSVKLYRKLNVWQSRFENVSSERPESPVSHRCHRRHHDDDHDPAACGKSRHRASPALWVATIRMMTVVMMVMVMVMMMALAMTTTTTMTITLLTMMIDADGGGDDDDGDGDGDDDENLQELSSAWTS